MSTLLIQLVGPLQSWGTISRFDERDTALEPSKSGVLGLLAAALGIERNDWPTLEPLTHLLMGIRCDQEGISRYDFQTAENVATADGKVGKYPTISQRYYLADAAFTVGLQSTDTPLLKRIEEALRNPVWPLGLGRKSYVPSESIWLRDGLVDKPLKQALVEAPWLRRVDRPEKLRFVFESQSSEGSARMDQPVASFAERKFITRYVVSQYIPMEPALSASGAEKAADIEEADVPL